MTFHLSPPLVSVVVSNYNYGRFLKDAIESVRAQTYGNIECILVDDCSTDKSSDVIGDLEHEWPTLLVIRQPTNRGQSAAIIAGFAASRGDFVVFLDADDVLYPEFIARHVSLHMTSRRAVGFSCCDAVQIVGERMVVARNGNLSASFLRLPFEPNLMSSAPLSHLAGQGIHLPAVAEEGIRHIPWTNTLWPWTTTSSMCFRREALDLIIGAEGLSELRICTDNFLAHAVNHLSGSLIFDEQLVGYRLHGKNGFNKRPPMDGFICHDRADDHYAVTCRLLLGDLIRRFEHYSANMAVPDRVFSICMKLDRRDDRPNRPKFAGCSQFANLLRANQKEIAPFVGRVRLARWATYAIVRLRVFEFLGLYPRHGKRKPPTAAPTVRRRARSQAGPEQSEDRGMRGAGPVLPGLGRDVT